MAHLSRTCNKHQASWDGSSASKFSNSGQATGNVDISHQLALSELVIGCGSFQQAPGGENVLSGHTDQDVGQSKIGDLVKCTNYHKCRTVISFLLKGSSRSLLAR